MMRVAIELGLHHDPDGGPDKLFTLDEAEERKRLWYICLIHDRGTSIIFGRPLCIQRADFNTPFPSRYVPSPSGEQIEVFSEHFELSTELLHVQGDIVNSLYRPGQITADQMILRAIEVERSLEQWRNKMPTPYQQFFTHTGGTSLDNPPRVPVTSQVNVDRGLSLLKYTILRMFLLRAIVCSRNIESHVRYKALHDGEHDVRKTHQFF